MPETDGVPRTSSKSNPKHREDTTPKEGYSSSETKLLKEVFSTEELENLKEESESIQMLALEYAKLALKLEELRAQADSLEKSRKRLHENVLRKILCRPS